MVIKKIQTECFLKEVCSSFTLRNVVIKKIQITCLPQTNTLCLVTLTLNLRTSLPLLQNIYILHKISDNARDCWVLDKLLFPLKSLWLGPPNSHSVCSVLETKEKRKMSNVYHLYSRKWDVCIKSWYKTHYILI